MKFKYVQTRLVRYTVVIEAPDMDIADDKIHQHEEWSEDGVEEEDLPWREDCPDDADPDIYIVGGHAIPAYTYLRRELTPPLHDCEGTPVTVGARVMYQRGTWDGAPWFPGTVTFLHDEYGSGTLALVEDDDKGINKYGMWVGSQRIKVGVPEVVPVYDAWAEEEEDEPDVDPVEDDDAPVEDDILEDEGGGGGGDP